MNAQTRQKLLELMQAGDTALLQDASRVRAVLADAAPGATREIAALATAVEENVPPGISRASASLSLQGSLDRLARTLADNRALSLGAATWAVQSWAWVLQKGPPPDDAAGDTDTAPSPPMRSAPRRTLQQILQTYGTEVQQDASLLRALLGDLAPGFRREQAALVAAVQEGVANRIVTRSQPNGPLPVPQLAERLMRGQALSADAATWAVTAWAWALGKGPEPQDLAADATSDGVPPPAYQPPAATPPPSGSSGRPEPSGAPPWSPPASEPEETTVPRGPAPARPPGHPGGMIPPPPRPPLTRPRRRMWPVVIGAAIVLAGGTTAAVAAINDGNSGGSGGSSSDNYPDPATTTTTTYTTPPTVETTTPDDPTPTTTEPTLTWAEFISQTFYAPSDDCETVSTDVAGVEYAMLCELTTDGNGNYTSDPVTVRYMGWSSLSDLNSHFDEDAIATGYTEDTWHFAADSSTPQGRLIQFLYDDGDSGLDWSYESKLLTGEARSAGSQESLYGWWRSATD